MITKVNIKLHRYVGLYTSELNLFWNIYVNIEYRTTYKHVWTCLSDLKFKKILLISLDFTHKQEKKSCEILWNIYVNIKYIVRRINMSEHVCLTWSSKRSFSSVQIFTHMKQEKKNLVDAFYTQGGVLNFNQQLTMYHGAKIIMKLHQNHCSIAIWQNIFKTFHFCQWVNMWSKQRGFLALE